MIYDNSYNIHVVLCCPVLVLNRWRAKREKVQQSLTNFKFVIQIDEKVDARDLSMGAWFEAQVVKVTVETPCSDGPCSSSTQTEDVVYYHVQYDE